MDLHPYDGKQRRFRDGDPDRRDGLALVVRLLRLPLVIAWPETLRYDLSFYSGGMGVLDRLAISIEADDEEAETITTRLDFVPIARAWHHEAIRWLLAGDDEDGATAEAAARAFIADHRHDFQPTPTAAARCWIDPAADVNSWQLAYACDGVLHYLAYDQG